MKTFRKICFMVGGAAIMLGIVFLIIGLGMRYSVGPDQDNNYDFTEEYEDVKSIDLQISYGSVIINRGDTFHIDAYNMSENDFSSTMEDGVWLIRDNKELGYDIQIFDLNIPVNMGNVRNEEDMPQVLITLPEDFIAEDIEINLGAGKIEADSLTAEEANLYVGAGSFRIHDLIVKNKSYYSVAAGELIIDNMNVNNVIMDNGVGTIKATGIITGDSSMKSGIGTVNLNVNGRKENYNYSIDCGVGTVIINHNRYSDTTINSGAENNFTLECGIGNITLNFYQ